jgi:NAD(P)-dependent dehydrogenase (short-subunit alcohol dehydrogenase family)
MGVTSNFDGLVVFVTGGSAGIGQAVVRQFLERGARVASMSRQHGHGQQAVTASDGSSGMAIAVAGDVAVEADVVRCIAEAVDRFGKLDILVNNAAVYMQGDAGSTTLDDWNRLIGINLTGAFLCTRHALPHLAATRGTIVNISSEAGLVGIAGQVAYNVSKAGMIALTKSCAIDFAARGVRVNCVCPGTTATPLVEEALSRAADPIARRRQLESCRPADRLGTPDEIAAAVLFLASREAAYATGAVLSVDGGYTAQ